MTSQETASDHKDTDQPIDWNGRAGQNWVELQATIEALFRPFEAVLVDAAQIGAGDLVLDIGCGTGATTMAAASAAAPSGHAFGIDISGPMIAAARRRAQDASVRADFIEADAATHDFGDTAFDKVISRFGVMFFEDPVGAFANIRSAMSPGGKSCFLVWRGREDNPFMTVAGRAAAVFLPELAAPGDPATGQFAFADPDRVRPVLTQAGWRSVAFRPVDVDCTMPESQLALYFTRLGPLGRVFPDLDEAVRTKVVAAVRAAFEPFVQDGDVRFTAACWLVTADA